MFIGSGAFTEGDNTHPPPIPKGHLSGTSTFKGAIVFANVDRTLAQALLPAGLTLANCTQSLHPILHLAGLQENIGVTDENGNTVYGYTDYREFIVAVPFVLTPFSTQWHNYVVRMYLNNELAKFLGLFFAFRKEIGFVHLDQIDILNVRVDNGPGDTVFSGTIQDIADPFEGSDKQADASLPNYPEMKRIIGMPMLGVDPDETGDPFRAFSRFEWDVAAASVTEIGWESIRYKADFDAATSGLVGLPLASEPGSAVVVKNVKWKLSTPPLQCDPAGNPL